MPFGKARAFTVGVGEGADFALAGFQRFDLVRVGPDGAVVRFGGKLDGVRTGPEGETALSALASSDQAYADGDGHAFELEGRDVVKLTAGNIRFEVFRLNAPPMELTAPFENVDFTWANLLLALFALAGAFVMYAANRADEGDPLADTLTSDQQRLVKTLFEIERPKPVAQSGGPAAPAKEGKRAGPPAEHKPPKPNTADKPGKGDIKALVQNIFAPSAMKGVFGPAGFGEELAKSVGGIQGAGLGGKGLGLKGDDSGLGGKLLGIGGLGGKRGHGGGGGPYGFGLPGDCGMKCKTPTDQVIDPGPVNIQCGENGVGCLDKDLVRKVIHANAAAYRYCYEQRLNSHPSLAGKVSVRFGINPAGQVPTATIAQSTVGDTELDTCVLGRTKLLQFPARKTDGLVLVTYPFVFKAAGSN
ncbi:MAG: AgmX/PglI C-terminal domain-containing protein [Myxococcaceae bacterium]